MKSNSEARPSTVFLLYYMSIFKILQPPGSGCHEIKVINYPTETEHEAMGQRQRTEDHWKVIFASVFFLPSYVLHVSMPFEKSRQLSVLWTIWNFSMISAEKVQDHLIFVITVEWISLVKDASGDLSSN